MTGQGEATHQREGIVAAVEIRTINGRYFKMSYRGSDGCAVFESRIDSLVRKSIRRGSVQLGLKISRDLSPDNYELNTEVLSAYRRQLEKVYDQLHVANTVQLESLLLLPGVIEEAGLGNDDDKVWAVAKEAIQQALQNLEAMREEEGRAMTGDLADNAKAIAVELDAISARTPQVVEAYRERLRERISQFLQEHDVKLEASDLLREVAVFSERADISEEVVRLRSHLEQFDTFVAQEESTGRKLEFLTQEMFRETNTIGSKANDAEIARHVIEIKAAIERMREMIQNVE